MAKDCPKCRLINPPSARRCDCGFDFLSKTVEDSYLRPRSGASKAAGAGIVLVVVIFVLRFVLRALEW